MKKNMAVSDVGVACHKKMNAVGKNILGSFTVSHRKLNCDLDVSKNPIFMGPLSASSMPAMSETTWS